MQCSHFAFSFLLVFYSFNILHFFGIVNTFFILSGFFIDLLRFLW
nr:MAG TPA: hypothetical protein [Caudoviricetes sp.]